MMLMYEVSIGGGGFSLGRMTAKTKAQALKLAIELASQLPQPVSGRRPVGVTVGKEISKNAIEVVAYVVPLGGDMVGEYGSEADIYWGFDPKQHKAPAKVRTLSDEALDAAWKLAGRKRGPRSISKKLATRVRSGPRPQPKKRASRKTSKRTRK